MHLNQFLTYKSMEFWKYGIFMLSERWQKGLDNKGTYILDLNLKITEICISPKNTFRKKYLDDSFVIIEEILKRFIFSLI